MEATSHTTDSVLIMAIIKLLTPKVVVNLPPYFKNINSILDAQKWFEKMVSESRLFLVIDAETDTIIGFVFIFIESSTDAHIGYLLGESYWNKGYATELLKGMIDFVNHENKLNRLIAGVDVNNLASIKLLNKLGFTKSFQKENEPMFYEYKFINHN